MSYLPYTIAFAFTGFLTLGIAIWGWHRRERTGLLAFSVFMFLSSVWPLVQSIDVATANLTLKIFLMKIRMDAPVFAGLAYLVMVAELTELRSWSTRRRLAILSIIPLIGIVLNWTSPNLIFRYDYHLILSGPFPILSWVNGPLYYVWSFYGSALYLIPLFLLAYAYRNMSELSSRQALVLIVATPIPLITNMLFNLGLSPVPGFNATPLTIAITSSIIAWAILSEKTFDAVPVARGKLVSSMKMVWLFWIRRITWWTLIQLQSD